MNLRLRFAIALGALAAAATITAAVTSYISTRDRLNSEVDAALEDVARVGIQDRSFVDRGRGGISPLGSVTDRFELYVFQTLSSDGTPIVRAETISLPVDDADRAVARNGGHIYRTIKIDTTPYRMLTTRSDRGGPLGIALTVQVARDLTATQRLLDSLRNRYILLGIVVSAAAAAFGWIIAQRTTRSFMKLTRAVEHVGETGRLDIPVDVEGRDEAGRLANAFNGMLQALARSRQQQQQLIQDAGHELRTPLTSMRTNVSLLRQADRLGPDATKSTLSDLESELGELTSLFNELVELATDTRDEEPQQDVSLERLALRASERLGRRTGRTAIVSSDGTIISGRPLALERAVRNLLDNAAKFDSSNEPIEVTIRGGRVEVRDHGLGISPVDIDHVFDRFYRSDAARNQPGSGLGLAIVSDIAAAHGGRAFAYNHPDGGAVVGFDLNIEVPEPPYVLSPPSDQPDYSG